MEKVKNYQHILNFFNSSHYHECSLLIFTILILSTGQYLILLEQLACVEMDSIYMNHFTFFNT